MKTYQTHDLYAASALKINSFVLIDLIRDEKGRGIFVFQDRDDRPRIVRDYFSGQLTGSLKGFANAWADLKALVNEMEMNSNHADRTQTHK